MALILCIETSTKNCSVALSRDGETLAVKEESSDQYIHSEKLHVFIESIMQQHGLGFSALDAIAVGMGPGSYTGLRIGVSAAKGFAYTLEIPLLAVDGLENLAKRFLAEHSIEEDALVLPMLDARRMEVYCAVYKATGELLTPIEAKVVEEGSFVSLNASKIYLLGDGAPKSKTVLTDDRFELIDQLYPSAKGLGVLANAKLKAGKVEDVAYFEPFYLKDFVAGKPKKLL
jgi:tRNA threonylcarbamoyladenosine biosynthesis protein TsaB